MIFTSKSCIVLYVICSLTAGEISNFVLGISSFITAIVTAIVLIKQYMLQRKSYQIERKLKQPVFNIKLVTIDEDNDNKHDNEIMTIQNDGYIVKEISKITVNTIFDVSERSKHNAFRIIGYFSLITMYQSLNGLIYKSRGLNNHAKFINVYLDALALYKEHRRYVELSVHHITKIEYTDIYGEKNVCCFKDRSNISEDVYNTILKQICNQQNPMDIDKVSFRELLEEFSSAN